MLFPARHRELLEKRIAADSAGLPRTSRVKLFQLIRLRRRYNGEGVGGPIAEDQRPTRPVGSIGDGSMRRHGVHEDAGPGLYLPSELPAIHPPAPQSSPQNTRP